MCYIIFKLFLMVLQTGIEPEFVLFFDCSEEEMERRVLSRNQVTHITCASTTILFYFSIFTFYNTVSPF